MALEVTRLDHGVPFGTLDAVGADGVVETEFLIGRRAVIWATSEAAPRAVADAVPYRCRVLVRRSATVPASGVVHVEPLHPHLEAGLTWDAAGRDMLARGHTWIGVQVYPGVAGLLAARVDPERYGTLAVPAGAEWSIMRDAIAAARAGGFDVPCRVVILSGWSATGSFCRVFGAEGFGDDLVDGIVIVISSGGAGEAGYPRLSPGDPVLPAGHPRRTVRGFAMPVFEIISETEAPSHRPHLREDSDEPGDRYRLFQIAGAAHVEDWPVPRTDNAARLGAVGVPVEPVPIREQRTDARTDLIATALLERMVRWVRDGSVPVRADRFRYEDGGGLARDEEGNVIGGVRAPWVAAPLAGYRPGATPLPGIAVSGPEWTPLQDVDRAAALIGVMERFPVARVLARYGGAAGYRTAFDAAVAELVAHGLLLPAGAEELRAGAERRWAIAVGASA